MGFGYAVWLYLLNYVLVRSWLPENNKNNHCRIFIYILKRTPLLAKYFLCVYRYNLSFNGELRK